MIAPNKHTDSKQLQCSARPTHNYLLRFGDFPLHAIDGAQVLLLYRVGLVEHFVALLARRHLGAALGAALHELGALAVSLGPVEILYETRNRLLVCGVALR